MRWIFAASLCLSMACAAATTDEDGPERNASDRGGTSGRAPIDTGGPPAPDAHDTAGAVDAEGSGADTEGSGDASGLPGDVSPHDSGADAPVDTTPAPDTADTDAAPDNGGLADGRPVADDCEQLVATAEPVFRPVDIVWVIDTSGSMSQEIALIEREMANFVAFIGASELDYRVVLIAADPPTGSSDILGVCLPEPLSGAPGCPDTNSERYLHVRETVGSSNAFEVIVEVWAEVQPFLRPNASTHFVVVTDDESDRNSSWFGDRMSVFLPQGYTFHSIVSLVETEDCILFICDTDGCEGPHGNAVARGSQYMALSASTGGIEASICDADWAPIFDAIAAGVVDGAALPCDYDIPEIPSREIVYDRVEVTLTTPEGETVALERVDGPEACVAGAAQWYYDDNEAPTRVQICADACGERAGSLEIGFDCVKA